MTQKIYHLDCFSGLAGDMFLGACLDLGMPLQIVTEGIDALGLQGVSLEARRSTRGGIGGVRFRVLSQGRPIEGLDPEEGAELTPGPALPSESSHADAPQRFPGHHHADPEHDHEHRLDHGRVSEGSDGPEHQHRSLSEIRRFIARSGLTPPVRERADEMFCRLGQAEAEIHQVDLDRVHFHEVGAIDSIVDIVGAAIAIEFLESSVFTVSSIVVGSGTISSSHGRLPIPAPATLALLAGIDAPCVAGPAGELLTPTGALILSQLAPRFVAAPAMKVEGQGFGLGRWELTDRANAVRLIRGQEMVPCQGADGAVAPGPLAAAHGSQVAVLECQIDDLTGEGFGYLQERLFDDGALDCFYSPVQMKKGRPGVHVTVLTKPEDLERLAEILMVESGSLGCRYRIAQRFVATRSVETVQTRWGAVRIKSASLRGREWIRTPEFEDCRALALANGLPWREVHLEAQRLAAGGGPEPSSPAEHAPPGASPVVEEPES